MNLSQRVFELFDLVCGTSTGGVIVLGTCVGNGVRKVPIADLVTAYEHKAGEIFNGNGKAMKAAATLSIPQPGAKPLEFKPKHNCSGLEKLLQANAAQPRDRFDREEQYAM